MNIEPESLPAVRPGYDPRERSDVGTVECDWCGRDVHRETAVGRDDGILTVLLCPECESAED